MLGQIFDGSVGHPGDVGLSEIDGVFAVNAGEAGLISE